MRFAGALLAGWITAFVLVVAAPAGPGDSATLKAEFLRDYPRALGALEARFQRVRGVVKCADARFITIDRSNVKTTDTTRIRESTLEFECKLPSMMRVVETRETEVTKGGVRRKSMLDWLVRGSNDNYSFELNKIAADGKFSVTSLLNRSEAKSNDATSDMADELLGYLGASFCLDRSPMSAFFSAKNFSIRSVSRVHEGTKELLKAEFELAPARKGAIAVAGWFTVSPSEAWVLHDYKFERGDTSRLGSVEYGEMQAGVTVPRRFTVKFMTLGELMRQQTYDFEKLEFVDVPDRDFTLTAFDLPEVGRPTGRRSASPAPWLMAFSISALAAAVFLKMAASRVQKKVARGPGT